MIIMIKVTEITMIMDNEDEHSDVDDNNSYSKKIFAS